MAPSSDLFANYWSRANRYLDRRHPGAHLLFPRKSRDDHVYKARKNVEVDALYDRRRRTRAAPVAEGRAAKASPLPSAGCTLRGRRASDPAAAAAEPARRESPRYPTSDKAPIVVRTDVEALVVRRVNSARLRTFPEAKRGADMACCGTRSRVDGPEACTVCLEPLPLPGPGGDCVLVLHACGHAFHRDCAQDFLLDALRRRRTPRCPNCRATLHTAPFGKLLGQRKLPRSRRMKNMRQLITVSEVRRFFYLPPFSNHRPLRFFSLAR